MPSKQRPSLQEHLQCVPKKTPIGRDILKEVFDAGMAVYIKYRATKASEKNPTPRAAETLTVSDSVNHARCTFGPHTSCPIHTRDDCVELVLFSRS